MLRPFPFPPVPADTPVQGAGSLQTIGQIRSKNLLRAEYPSPLSSVRLDVLIIRTIVLFCQGEHVTFVTLPKNRGQISALIQRREDKMVTLTIIKRDTGDKHRPRHRAHIVRFTFAELFQQLPRTPFHAQADPFGLFHQLRHLSSSPVCNRFLYRLV